MTPPPASSPSAAGRPLDTFLGSLDELGVDWTLTDSDSVESTVEGLVESPAVGTRFPGIPPSVTLDPTPAELREAVTGVTAVAFAIADYGSVVVRADEEGTEQVSLFCDRHVAVCRASDVVPDMPAAFERFGELLREERGSAVVATGPSATADMGALVKGAHGPKDVHVVVVEEDDE